MIYFISSLAASILLLFLGFRFSIIKEEFDGFDHAYYKYNDSSISIISYCFGVSFGVVTLVIFIAMAMRYFKENGF